MRKLKWSQSSTILAMGALLFMPACQEKPAENAKADPAKKGANVSSDDDPNPTPGEEGFELCDSLRKSLKGDLATSLAAQIDEFCDEESIATLRSKDYVYAGTGTVSLAAEEPVTKNDVTSIRLFTSMLVPVTPLKYFEMMKLSLSEPSEFKSKGYKYDTAIELSVSSKSDERSTFTFSREAQNTDEANVEYEAKANFITLQEDSAYAIATVSTKGIKTVKNLKILALILKKGDKTEVFSISDQSFENQGKAESAVTKYKARIASEVKKNYENGKQAESSD